MRAIFQEHIQTIEVLSDQIPEIEKIVDLIVKVLRGGNKVLICGNGGSASDAQHIASELSGKFYKLRSPLNVQALHTNGSYLTAVANDIGFEKVFCRAVSAHGASGDLLIALSTSGNSPNILEAIIRAKKLNLHCVGLTGQNGGELAKICPNVIKVPSTDVARIQEAHILVGHIICQYVEEIMFPE